MTTSAWTRREGIALAVLVIGALASLPFTTHAWYDATNDGSMYLAGARSLLDGEGYAYLGEPFRIRPPGWSLMMTPLLAVFGTDFHVLNLFTGLWGVAAVALVFVFQRPRLGWHLALLVAASLWLEPGFRRSCNQIMSDMPGLAFLLGGLLLERWAARSPSARREILLGSFVGLACYVRSIDALLVPAIAVSRVLGRMLRRDGVTLPWSAFLPRRVALFAAVAGLVILPWSVRN